MRERVSARAKIGLVKAGALLPERTLYHMNAAMNYLWVGFWMRTRGFHPSRYVRDRYALFDLIIAAVQGRKVVYLEFGVSSGASIAHWSERLTNPACQLHGFDSFEGLPTDWVMGRPAGYFSTDGRPPAMDDARVTFHKGWFEDTVPAFVLPAFDKLVLMLDADLYRSTCTVLESMRDKIRPGTFVYFDEFNHRADELRAFDEFLSSTSIRFRLFAATRDFAHVAFEAI